MSARPEFHPSILVPGQKIECQLTVGPIVLPVLVACGASPGKTLLVTAGVHGDEYEGMQAIYNVYASIDANALCGVWIAIPVANPPAFWAGTRTSPIDGGNLARVFPGDAEGTATSAIAWHIDQKCIAIADFYIDLHSAGVKWWMPTLVGYHEPDHAARDAAEVLNTPVIWCHPTIAPGRTVSAAMDRGVPCLYMEAHGAGRIAPDDLAVFEGALRRLMQHLGQLPFQAPPPHTPVRLYGDGNIDRGITATEAGFLSPNVTMLEPVQKGQLLGTLLDPWGAVIAEYLAPSSGVIVLIHAFRLVAAGEPLFLITDRVQ